MVNTESTTPRGLDGPPASLEEAVARSGLFQNEVARRVGVTSGAMSLWVSGDRNPSGPSRRQLAQVLAVSLDVVDSWFPAAPGCQPEAEALASEAVGT